MGRARLSCTATLNCAALRPATAFPDTGVLLAVTVFPRGREAKLSLAGEVLELHHIGAFELIVSRVVVDELEEVLNRDFPRFRLRAVQLVARMGKRLARRPTPVEIAAALPYASDRRDAPVFAAAVIAAPDVVLSNDFRAFNAPRARQFWQQHGLRVESLYGLLCMFGLRECRDAR